MTAERVMRGLFGGHWRRHPVEAVLAEAKRACISRRSALAEIDALLEARWLARDGDWLYRRDQSGADVRRWRRAGQRRQP